MTWPVSLATASHVKTFFFSPPKLQIVSRKTFRLLPIESSKVLPISKLEDLSFKSEKWGDVHVVFKTLFHLFVNWRTNRTRNKFRVAWLFYAEIKLLIGCDIFSPIRVFIQGLCFLVDVFYKKAGPFNKNIQLLCFKWTNDAYTYVFVLICYRLGSFY